MLKKWVVSVLVLFAAVGAAAQELDAADIIRKAMEHYRGLTSYSELTMIIHRPDWERSMTMRAWTEGEKRTLVRVVEPKKDAGNGTLSVDGNMWTYTPKINRVIKIPSSMMSQSWMGSDFSNKDVSKDTVIIDQYDHTLLDQYEPLANSEFVLMESLAVAGQRDRANAIATRIDAEPFGYLQLNFAIHSCMCGAPFDLEVTPNYAKLVQQAELPWPPLSPIDWPLKDW